MAKKKKKIQETTIEDYYDLKTDKVDELVAALKDESTTLQDDINFAMNASMGVDDPANRTKRGKDKKFDPYRTDFLGKIPTWIKALFIKWWFAGVVCYFVLMPFMNDPLDATFLAGAAMGLVTDILVNPLFRFMESDSKEYNAYMMFPFPFKAAWTLFANIVYYCLVGYLVSVIVTVFVAYTPYSGTEPLSFGLFALAVDMAFIGIKDGVVALVRHIKNKKKEKALNV